MSRNLKMVVALRDWGDVQQLNAVFGPGNANGIEIVTWTQDGSRVFNDATSLDADIVLMDPTVPAFEPNDVQRLYHHEQKPIVTLGAIPPQGDWGSKLYQLGIKGHVDLPIGEAQARALVAMAHKAVQEALRERSSTSYIPQVSTQVAQVIATHGWEKSVVAVWGAKGGVGKSTIAENLAAILGVLANRNTVLVDANMAGGNVHIHFGVPESQIAKNIAALARRYQMNLATQGYRASGNVGMLANQPVLTPTETQGNLTLFRNNLRVLIGIPKQFMGGDEYFQGELGRGFMHELLSVVSGLADFVVIDLGQDTNSAVHLQALRDANYVFVVINPDAASVRATGEVMETLFKHVQLDAKKFRLIVNRFHPEHGILRKDIVNALQMPEVGVVPEGGPKVTASLNRGYPLVLDSRGELARALVSVASTLYPPVNQIWAHRGRLGGEKQDGLGKRLSDLVLGT
ncbi:MAG: AAA family ATPase [Chloroflexi bacterium]|nr:AAA family ATPase [Chloroflexota bacterium]